MTKFHLLGDPVSSVGLASAIADAIMVASYVGYLISNNYADNNAMDLYKFIKNSITNALEKVLAVSTLEIIVSVFMVTISTTYSDIYFGLDRFYQPCLLFSYAFLEWVIYSQAKGFRTKRRAYLYYLLLLIPYNLVLIVYLHLDYIGILFSCIYLFYIFSFMIERTFVGLLFSAEQGKTVNYIVLIKDGLLLITLSVLAYNDAFSLISFGLVNLLFICLEIVLLGFAASKKRLRHFPTKQTEISTKTVEGAIQRE